MRARKTSSFGWQIAAVALACLFGQAARGAVTFSVTPGSVTNQYSGLVTLQITGLNTGETVTLQKYVDANANGVVDSADLLVQQFQLTDNQGPPVIAGVTNINVPGDLNSANGAITAELDPLIESFGARLVAQHIFVLSSPTGRFAPLTAVLDVTPSFTGQSISGGVTCDGTNVPDAVILLFRPKSGSGGGSDSEGFNPVGGTLANNSGVFTLKLAPGTYQFAAFKYGFVTDTTKAVSVTLASGATATTNLSLLPATTTISGKFVDATNSALGLPGVLLGAQSSVGLFSITTTISNGGFSLTVTPGQWGLGADQQSFDPLDYVGLNNGAEADTSTGAVTGVKVAFPKAAAYIYGSVRDAQNNPLPGVRLSGDNGLDGNGTYAGDATTDQHGNYVMAANAGVWSPAIGGGDNALIYDNYVFSAGPAWTFNNGGDGTNLAAGTAALADFIGLPATNRITGSLTDGSGRPITNVSIYAYATINGATFNQNASTDVNGDYSITAGNGSWTVGVNCCNGGNCDNALPSNDSCPNQQPVNITNKNVVVNFVSGGFPYQITGSLTDNSGNPIPNVQIYASANIGANDYNQSATTDSNGLYSLSVANGTWTVGVNCCSGTNCSEGLPAPYACPNQQMVNISGGDASANFVAVSFPHLITGSLTDQNGNPIPNVQITASGSVGGGSYTQNGITGANGDYSIAVASGSWQVAVTCCNGGDCPNGLPTGYECDISQQTVNISNGNGTANFVAPAVGTYQVNGEVLAGNPATGGGVGIPNAVVTASSSGNPNVVAMTSTNGSFTLYLAPGDWTVSVACDSLTAQGYACVTAQTVQVTSVNAGQYLGFFAQPCGPLQITTTTLPVGLIGSNYTSQLLSSGCHSPFAWSLTPGSLPLPQGLLLSTNGVVSGTPAAAGTNYFSARVKDSLGTNADLLLAITVYPPLLITNASLPNGTLGVSYSAQLETTGGSGGFFGANVDSGTLPPGLFLNSDGSISGMPAQLGTFQFTVQVIGNFVPPAQASFTIVISQPSLQITTTAVSGALAGQPFSFQLQASGGTAPYTWSVAQGSQGLPAGLSLSTNGLITGAAVAGGASTVILRVTDAHSLTTTASVQISVGAALTLASPSFSPIAGFRCVAIAPTGQTYTVQYSLTLTNWTALLVTNPAASPFTIVDAGATNQHRFYRLLLPAP